MGGKAQRTKNRDPPGITAMAMLGRPIGQGGSSVVRCAEGPDGLPVAVKVVCGDRLPQALREVDMLETLDHPNVVRLQSFRRDEESVEMVMELMERDLQCLIAARGRISEPEARALFAQLIEAVTYVHSRGIVHLDIKPENLLLDHCGNLKLADFGISCWQPEGGKVRSRAGTPACVAPEVLDDCMNSYDGTLADTWSCGVVLYAMLAGTLPFSSSHDTSVGSVLRRVRSGRFVLPRHLSPLAKDLIRSLLVVDPSQRMTLELARQHSWMTECCDGAFTTNPLHPTPMNIPVAGNPVCSPCTRHPMANEPSRPIPSFRGACQCQDTAGSVHNLSDANESSSFLIFSLHDLSTELVALDSS
eukprot:NODE_491_length_1425_cov_131.662791_g371_i0.p1 GENE.NODE_491_length_1425_cov_131.662791_g371_i0~~NODE_491_length_1425_cov_131.662791_g371_i0.p1  ORF type:complete len:360 (+),score=44.15 NODE_491_length_1425_cov_131.662791_g371_i0:28-1107(+)